MSDIELQPDTREVLQEEAPDAVGEPGVIRVCIQDAHSPLRVQMLPRKGATSRTLSVGATPYQVAWANPRRGRLVLMAMDQNLLVAFSQASAQDDSTMGVWPKLVPLEITATVDVWVRAATSTTALSITAEFWAEGE